MKMYIDESDKHFWVIKNAFYNFVIPCFNFELSAILQDLLMTSFCFEKVKKVYETDYVSKRKLTKRTFLQLSCLSRHHGSPRGNFYSIHSAQLKCLLQLYLLSLLHLLMAPIQPSCFAVQFLGWPFLSPFSWSMKMMKTKANQGTTRARYAC